MKCTLGRSSCPLHAEHLVTWNTRGCSGSDSSSTCLNLDLVSRRYELISCWSYNATEVARCDEYYEKEQYAQYEFPPEPL